SNPITPEVSPEDQLPDDHLPARSLPEDSQAEDWDDSLGFNDTQEGRTPATSAGTFVENRHIQFAQPTPMYPVANNFGFVEHHSPIGEQHMYGFRNFAQGLNLNARFYPQ
ncbi:hypothetical protein KC19_2G156800, partial [Ceratodon purpureus]